MYSIKMLEFLAVAKEVKSNVHIYVQKRRMKDEKSIQSWHLVGVCLFIVGCFNWRVCSSISCFEANHTQQFHHRFPVLWKRCFSLCDSLDKYHIA